MSAELQPDSRLGPYLIEAKLTSGASGELYSATDTRNERAVILKTFPGPLPEEFRRQAEALESIDHPHIARVLEVGDDYLVMEPLGGAPL